MGNSKSKKEGEPGSSGDASGDATGGGECVQTAGDAAIVLKCKIEKIEDKLPPFSLSPSTINGK